MPTFRPTVTSLVMAMALSACALQAPGLSERSLATDRGRFSARAGQVLANNGANFVSNNSGSLIGKVKAPATLISDRGMGLRLLALPAEAPLAGAEVRLVGLDGQPVPDVRPVLTDEAGRFELAGVPALGNALVEAAGAGVRLSSVVFPRTKRQDVEVTAAATLASDALSEAIARNGAVPARLGAAEFGRMLATVTQALTQASVPLRLAGRESALETFRRLAGARPEVEQEIRNIVVLIGAEGEHYVSITGNDNVVVIQQDEENTASVTQEGDGNTAVVAQEGASNSAEVEQTGDGNTAVVEQSGSGNTAVVNQGP